MKPRWLIGVTAILVLLGGCVIGGGDGNGGAPARYDLDDNPPGKRGGPGTNWENPPGPRGGPGKSPDG